MNNLDTLTANIAPIPEFVNYEGRVYRVRGLFCGDSKLLFLESRTDGGSPFPAPRRRCFSVRR